MAAHSNRKSTRSKTSAERPPKPYKDFPLYAHQSGNWAKRIRGKFYYFGRWGQRHQGKMERLPNDGWKEALVAYKSQVDDLQAGRKPRATNQDGLTIASLCNRFLTAKHNRMESGELSPRTFSEYRQTTDRLVAFFGKTRLVVDLGIDDFETLRADIAKTNGPVRLGNEITRVRSVLKYAADNRLIKQPINYGTEFRKPGKSVLRRHKACSDKKLFTAKEIRSLLDAADNTMRAAILLGINCGAGNTDVANLEFCHVNYDSGWLNYPRCKTGISRRVPLWKDTVQALQAAIEVRPDAKLEVDNSIVLLSARRERLVRQTANSRTDGVSVGFGKLLRKLNINGRKGLGFYSLRHTFATIGLETGDRDAVRALMGHAENDMLSAYDESGPKEDRLLAVTDRIRHWVFNK